MKVMFVCSGGMSTSLTAGKLMTYAKQKGVELSVEAYGTTSYKDQLSKEKYDMVMLAPQISYLIADFEKSCEQYEGLVVEKIPPQYYAPMDRNMEPLLSLILEKTLKEK